MEESTSPPPAPRYQNFRSTASVNWRMKDESPRPEQPQTQTRTRSNRDRTDNNQNSNAQTYSRNRNAQQSGDDAAAGTRLYVGNLLYTAQRTDIEDLFKGYGFNVTSVSISTDPFTGRNPSYCFVDLGSAEEAQRAMSELNGVDVLGRPLRVSPGVAKRSGQGGEGGGTEARNKDYERGPGQPRGVRETTQQKDGEHNPSFDRWNRTDAQSHWTAPQSEGRRLYMGNMPRIEPQSAHEQEVQDLFAQYAPGIPISAVSKPISPRAPPGVEISSGNQYYCFIDLEKGEDVDAVIEALDGKEGSWGGRIKVNRARNSDRKVVKEQGLRNQERQPIGDGTWRR